MVTLHSSVCQRLGGIYKEQNRKMSKRPELQRDQPRRITVFAQFGQPAQLILHVQVVEEAATLAT